MDATLIIQILNLVSTLFMTGVIWLIQLVHYPLMGMVGQENFVAYERSHQRRITWIVGPAMLIESITSVLMIWFRPIPNTALLLMGVGLLFIIWTSTALLQIPCHSELSRSFNPRVHRQLVLTNWLRTICWTLRTVFVCWLLIESFTHRDLISTG